MGFAGVPRWWDYFKKDQGDILLATVEKEYLRISLKKYWTQISWQRWFIHYKSNRIRLEVFHVQACSAIV